MVAPKKDNKHNNKPLVVEGLEAVEAIVTNHGKVGRPTKYKAEYAQALVDYFKKSIRAYERVLIDNGEGRTRTEIIPEYFPTFQEFAAVHCDVSVDTLIEWAKAKNAAGQLIHPEFSEAYARARDLQAAILIKGSLVDAFKGNFAGLAAKNLIGWADKIESTVTEVSGMTAQAKAELDAVYQKTFDAAMARKKR